MIRDVNSTWKSEVEGSLRVMRDRLDEYARHVVYRQLIYSSTPHLSIGIVNPVVEAKLRMKREDIF